MRRCAIAVGVVSCFLAVSLDAQSVGIRQVVADDMRFIELQTQVRYSTMIVLPEGDNIIEVVCGDSAYWVIDAAQNIAHIKPAKDGATTNLNLITSTGAIYSFMLKESKATPDLKVYVGSNKPGPKKTKFFTVEQVEALKSELESQRIAFVGLEKRLDGVKAEAKVQAVKTRRSYRVEPLRQPPFMVTDMWGDDTHTYIKTAATELPAVYETLDGKPAIVNFTVTDGTYVIPKVVRAGYLVLGKKRLEFAEVTK